MNDSDVTFVMHGKIIPSRTHAALQSIRTNFPRSQIILSVEDGVNITSIMGLYDKVVYTELQENYYLDEWFHLPDNKRNKHFTLNKQRTEVYNGLMAAETNFVVKTRTDLIFENRNIIKKYILYSRLMNVRDERYSIFENRVLVGKFITGIIKFPFFVSDIIAFGLRKDLMKLYTGAVMSYEDITFFQRDENRRHPNPWNYSTRYSAEQQLWIEALKKNNANIDIPNSSYEVTAEMMSRNIIYLVNNFIVLDYPEVGIECRFSNHKWGIDVYNFLKLYMEHSVETHCMFPIFLFYHKFKNIFNSERDVF